MIGEERVNLGDWYEGAAVHAGVQARGVEAGEDGAEHRRDSEDSGSVGANAAQLDQGQAAGAIGWSRCEVSESGAAGDCAASGRAGTSQDGARHPGKSDGVLREAAGLKNAWIERHRARWPVSRSCKVLGVSASGDHEHCRRSIPLPRPGKRIGNEALLVHIRAVHTESRGEYGWPRVWKQLLIQGIRVGKERVRRLMQDHGIKARSKRNSKATPDWPHPRSLQRSQPRCSGQTRRIPRGRFRGDAGHQQRSRLCESRRPAC